MVVVQRLVKDFVSSLEKEGDHLELDAESS